MKEALISKCEQDFILRATAAGKRLDGRHTYEFREIKVSFGSARGSCQVDMGQTKVFAQVSCEVAIPKPSRPQEGLLFINVELSPMAAPNFEPGRLSEYGLEITRLLERCIVESRAVDLESLCIVAGEKVWTIRADIHVMNHDGNILDCASIATVAALAHFRRPDVTISGEEVTIHNLEDRHGVPLSIHHMPIFNTFAYYSNGKYMLVDPSEREERVMDGKMVVGMNIYQEICTLHVGGTMSLNKDQVFRCSQIAASKAKEIIEMVKDRLAADEQQRSRREKVSFVHLVEERSIANSKRPSYQFLVSRAEEKAKETVNKGTEKAEENAKQQVPETVCSKGTGTADVGGETTWTVSDNDDDSEDFQMLDIVPSTVINPKPIVKQVNPPDTVDLSGDSEEEIIVTLHSSDTVRKE